MNCCAELVQKKRRWMGSLRLKGAEYAGISRSGRILVQTRGNGWVRHGECENQWMFSVPVYGDVHSEQMR